MQSTRFHSLAFARCLIALAAAIWTGAFADELRPGPGLRVEGVPAVPASIDRSISRYNELRGQFLLGWHPERLEALVSRRGATTAQIFRITRPGEPPEQLTDFAEPIWNASFPRRAGNYFVFSHDEGGNERYRLHRFDLATRSSTPLSPPDKRTWAPTWSRHDSHLFYLAIDVGQRTESSQLTTEIRVVDARAPATDRPVAQLPGVGWTLTDISPDGRTLALVEWISATESYLWVVDRRSGERRRVTPRIDGEKVRYAAPSFDRSGRALVTSTDRGTEFRRLVAIDLRSGRLRTLAEHPWDVTWYVLSPDGRKVAYVTNEDGFGVLHLMDTASGRRIRLPPVPPGSIGNAQWHANGRILGFSVSTATEALSIHAIDLASGRVSRWSAPDPARVALGAFVDAELVRWKSFDGRMIPGFVFRPRADRFPGPRPVLIELHGGPESQWRPGFIGSANYWLDELGVALIYPNVRGSTGYGKTYVSLDDGMKREDAVRDVEALLDWIAADPGLDAQRILLTGSSYGGYLTLATATRQPDRIACAASDVGIANFVSFLENTESWRRDLRRVEYGDERDPAMRAFLERISPLAHAGRMRKPLLISHGANDPRVPVAEALRFAEAVRGNGIPAWTIVGLDEGHGFARRENISFLFAATVLFARQCLGLGVAGPS